MATTGAVTRASAFFKATVDKFLVDLDDDVKNELQNFTTSQGLYAELERIQREQGKSSKLRGMQKIQPFLDCLRDYYGVLDTISNIHPEVLASIWVSRDTQNTLDRANRPLKGPVKFILQVSARPLQCFFFAYGERSPPTMSMPTMAS